jgi:hypothetical protein
VVTVTARRVRRRSLTHQRRDERGQRLIATGQLAAFRQGKSCDVTLERDRERTAVEVSSVRSGTAPEQDRALIDRSLGELFEQARLTDAGFTGHDDHAAWADGVAELPAEFLDDPRAAHEWIVRIDLVCVSPRRYGALAGLTRRGLPLGGSVG